MEFKKLFPVFDEYKDLHYLDNAATTQKPKVVIDSISDYMTKSIGNPHRSTHKLSAVASVNYDRARERVKEFLNVPNDMELIFTAGATESINLIARSITKEMIEGKNNIVIVIGAHHSNMIPWQKLCEKYNLELRYIYDESDYDKIDKSTLLVAFPSIVNADGFVYNSKKLISLAKLNGAISLVDGAQAVGHIRVDLTDLDADFFVFSGHKMFALTGVGGVVAKDDILNKIEPFLFGGDMISFVEEQSADFAEIPERFEAGTQNTVGVHSLMAAVDFIEDVGLETIINHEKEIFEYAFSELSKIDGVDILSERGNSFGIIAFNLVDVHPHDVATILDEFGVAIRAGNHCCQPYLKYLNLNSSCRISFSIYNDRKDIDALVKGLYRVKEVFGV